MEIIARRLDLSSVDLLHAASAQEDEKPTVVEHLSGDALQSYHLLDAHLLIIQGQWSQAVTYLERLPVQSLVPYLQVQLYYLLGLAHLSQSQLNQSETALQKAERLAAKQNDMQALVRIANLFGAVYAAMHQYEQAIQFHRRGLELLQKAEPRDPFLLCEIYNALGLNDLHLNNEDAAVTMFKQALEIAEKLEQTEYAASVYWTMSKYYMEAEQYYLPCYMV